MERPLALPATPVRCCPSSTPPRRPTRLSNTRSPTSSRPMAPAHSARSGAGCPASRAADRCELPGPVDVGPMLDSKDGDGGCFVVDLVDDAIRAASRRPQSCEVALQRVTDSARVLAHRSDHELHDCGGDTLGKASELAFRGGCRLAAPTGESSLVQVLGSDLVGRDRVACHDVPAGLLDVGHGRRIRE